MSAMLRTRIEVPSDLDDLDSEFQASVVAWYTMSDHCHLRQTAACRAVPAVWAKV